MFGTKMSKTKSPPTIPDSKMELEFSDITYTVNKGWNEKGFGKTILHGVSGVFRAGQLTAIMGPSGAGKSSLLNIISGYRTQGAKGNIKINGKPLSRRLFQKNCRFISQEDQLPPHLTVGEAMHIAASLKLPSSMPRADREVIVNENLSILMLKGSYDTRTEMLSGGQRKRLSVALELINNPLVFFLDEPTSGLDNVSTRQTLKLLSLLAKGGRTIVCTIHQPSASLFDFFDSVYVLGRGMCVYQGTTKNLVPFLSSAGFSCPTYHNPADHVIEIVDGSEANILVLSKAMENGRISHSQSKETINQLDYTCRAITESETQPQMSRQSSSDNSDDFMSEFSYTHMDKYQTSKFVSNTMWHEFCVLIARMWAQIIRNKWGLKVQFFHHLVCGITVGGVFLNTADDAAQMYNHVKFCVGYALFHGYTYIILPALTFPAEVKVLKKEHFNRWYRMPPYFFANLLVKMPLMIFNGLIFDALMYFMSGLPVEFPRFFKFFLIGFVTALTADSLGMAIGSICNVTNGAALAPSIVAPFLGLSVYGLDFAKDISWFVQGLMKLSFLRCGTVATMITIFGNGRKTLECSDLYCHFKEPKKVLQFLNFENISAWTEIANIVALLIFFKIISYFALRLRLSIKEP